MINAKEAASDKTIFGVRALAFALLECRSQDEALKVMRYFAKADAAVSAPPKPEDQPDGFGTNRG